MNLGKRIEQARTKRGWTQPQLCAKVPGLSQQALDRLEKRDSKSSTFTLQLAIALEMRVEELLASGSLTLTPGTAEVQVTTPAPTVTVAQALPVVLGALSGLTPGQWAMVRARLDAMPGHPEADEDVAGDVLPLLTTAPAKRQGNA